MIKLEEFQFATAQLMALLTIYLMFLQVGHKKSDAIFSRARWLMAAGTGLLSIQFILQYELGFRARGITQGVFINLLFFTPACYLINFAILYIQRQGHIRKSVLTLTLMSFIITLFLLSFASFGNGNSLMKDTPEMRLAEYTGALLLGFTLSCHYILQYVEYRRMKRVLDNYYDHNRDRLLRWISQYSMGMLILIVMFSPIAIFCSNNFIKLYGALTFIFIFFNVLNFICYGVSNDAEQVEAAEQNAVEAMMEENQNQQMSEFEQQRVKKIVDRWITNGGYLHSGITMQTAVMDMKIPRYQLAAWLKTTEWGLFSPWLAHLRIEEAKRQLLEHPEWSNDSIAEHCGFSSRNYFQTVFKKKTGLTPAQYIERCENK